jgi:tetratricopeptide (TPR) repeat protein
MSYEQSAPQADKPTKQARTARDRRQKETKRRPGQRDPEKMLELGRERLAQRRWKEAASILKRALDADRGSSVAMGLLALANMHIRRFNEGEKLLKRALDAGPMEPEVHDIHGRILHSLGKLDAAANAFTRALQLNPQFAMTYRNLGILLLDAGIYDQSTEALITAIRLDPKDAVAFYHLGLIKKRQNLDAEAIDAYSMAVAIKPDYAEAHINLGKIAIDRGKFELGEKACRRAIEVDPTIAQAHVNLGMVLREQKKLDEALIHARKSVELDPADGPAQSNLGNVYMDLQRYQEALSCFRKAMEFQPSFATSYFNYGNALRLLHVLDKADEYYKKAMELDPKRGETHHNQGLVFQEQGNHEMARQKFREAVELTPNHLGLRFSLGLNLFKNGFFDDCWPYLEAGLEGQLRKPNRRFRVPRWQGEDISDKRILVWREQGVGDEIGYGRRFQHIIDKAGTALFEVDKRLLPIFQRSFPGGTFLPEKLDAKADAERTDCDVQLPAMNLYQFFPFNEEEVACIGSPKDDIEAAMACRERALQTKPYLQPDPERVEQMARRFAELPEGLRIGISWRSQYSHRDRDIHYTKLEMWAPILKLPGITLVNIQYDEREEEIAAVEEAFGVKIHRWKDVDLRRDLEAALALTSQLDMAITASTSPGRIANALGKEVWIMTAGGHCPDTPVRGEYGSKNRLIWRRFWKEDWSAIINRVARTLEARVDA